MDMVIMIYLMRITTPITQKHLIPQADHAGLSSAGDAKDDTTSPVAISTNAYNLLDFVTKYEEARCSGLFLSLLFSLSLFPGPPWQ
jgi:hypothetical protein